MKRGIRPGPMCVRWILAYLCLSLAVPGIAGAQEESRLERAQRYYEAGEYGKTIVELEAALVRSSSFSQADLATIHLYLGLAYLGIGRPERARQAFAESLRLDEELEVDPTLRSPEVEEVFERARWVVEEEASRWREEEDQGPEVPLGQVIAAPRGATGKTRCGGVWRSALLPGWGQVYGGRKIRGYAFLGIEIAALAAGAYAALERERAYDDYLNAKATSTPDRINSLYDDYRSRERTRNTLLIVAGGIWALNLLESILNDPSVPREESAMQDWQWGAMPRQGGWAVMFCRRF